MANSRAISSAGCFPCRRHRDCLAWRLINRHCAGNSAGWRKCGYRLAYSPRSEAIYVSRGAAQITSSRSGPRYVIYFSQCAMSFRDALRNMICRSECSAQTRLASLIKRGLPGHNQRRHSGFRSAAADVTRLSPADNRRQ